MGTRMLPMRSTRSTHCLSAIPSSSVQAGLKEKDWEDDEVLRRRLYKKLSARIEAT